MDLKINVIDAFTDAPFRGNPAAVIITEEWLSDENMQSIATENNLSETAFVHRLTNQDFEIRWFSPIKEIDFCGHATLASAFVIFSENPTIDTITFSAKAVGRLAITQHNDGSIQMSFPNRMPKPITKIPADLIAGLSISPNEVLLSEQAYFAIYENENDVHAVQQTPEYLKKLAPYDVVVTASSQKFDFISRYFWPANGGDEDPVTGSIHAGLAPYWAEKLGKTRLTAFQASTRGGIISCHVDGDRVFVSGQAVQYLKGIITL